MAGDEPPVMEEPPPSEERGYILVYKFIPQRPTSWKTNKRPPGERLGLLGMLRTPGLNLVIISLIAGLAVLAYVLYMYLTVH